MSNISPKLKKTKTFHEESEGQPVTARHSRRSLRKPLPCPASGDGSRRPALHLPSGPRDVRPLDAGGDGPALTEVRPDKRVSLGTSPKLGKWRLS